MEVNGHRFEKSLEGKSTDKLLTGEEAVVPQEWTIEFPAEWLNEGMNQIQMGVVKGRWCMFDCIRLCGPQALKVVPISSSLVTAVHAADFEYKKSEKKHLLPILVDMVQYDREQTITFVCGKTKETRLVEVGQSIQQILVPAVDAPREERFQMLVGQQVIYDGTVALDPQPLHEYADDVDLLMGTGNSRWMFKPSVSLPFGMVQIAPDNEDQTWKAGYEYTIENISGFNHFCDWTIDGFLMQPTCGELKVQPGPEDNPDLGYRSRIDKSTEKAEVGKYSVLMTDTKIRAEVSATERASIQRYTFPAGCKERRVLVDLFAPSEYPHNLQDVHVTKVSDTEVEGYATYFGAYTGYTLEQYYTIHFVMQFDTPFESMGGWVDDRVKEVSDYQGWWRSTHEFKSWPKIMHRINELHGKGDAGFFLNFPDEPAESAVQVRTGVSLVDVAGARNNLQQKKFYSNLYRAIAAKASWSDLDGRYQSRYPFSLAEGLQQMAHEEYPGDQMYTAGDYFGHEEMVDCYDAFYKQVSRFPKDGDVMSNYPEDFFAIKPLLTREWGDGVGEKPRVSLKENEEEQMKQCSGRLEQLNGHGYFDWCMLDANPHMAGHFVWSYNDYARGSEDQTMYCGVVDMNRYPKFCYYMLQSMRDPAISQPGLYEGPMVFIASYNASADFSSSTTDIMVFSNCEEVKLYRNDKLVGTQTRAERTPLYRPIVEKGGSPVFVFNAGGYEAGTLRAEALIDGKVVATHSVTTPGAATQLVVTPRLDGIQPVADGSDMIPVYITVCDANGTRVYDSSQKISLQVTGEGTLIGDTISRLGINPQEAEGGVAFAWVRTTRKAGNIRITATAEGLTEGKAQVKSVPFDGIYLPDGKHGKFQGKEEDNVVIKPGTWQKRVLQQPRQKIASVQTESEQKGYPKENIFDGEDHTWWIAGEDKLPQTVVVDLGEVRWVWASRIVFQKDSSSYRHKVETSTDGVHWLELYKRECTGWEFKPVTVDRAIRYLRLTIEGVSEGRAGVGEISLY